MITTLTRGWRLSPLPVFATLVGLLAAGHVVAAPPTLLRTANYEAPVRGDPDDLLLIPGFGFAAGDRVVYQAADAAGGAGKHPAAVPKEADDILGTAPVVQQAKPAYSLTVRLPATMRKGTVYRLWVVNAAGEWSDPVSINDPRPLWISPAYVYATADLNHVDRKVRVVGRNLAPAESGAVRIKLAGPDTYIVDATATAGESNSLQDYVAEAAIPARLAPGLYSVSVSRSGLPWVLVADQRFEVRPDPAAPTRLNLADSRFGSCQPDDGVDDSGCLNRAIDVARQAGGAIIDIPAGTWDLTSGRAAGAYSADGFVLPRSVQLRGAGSRSSFIVRHRGTETGSPRALLTLTSANSVENLSFADAERIGSPQEITPVIALGVPWNQRPAPLADTTAVIEDVTISGNVFRRVGRAIMDSGRPIRRLFITHNDFGAYETALAIPGNRFNLAQPYRIDDSVVRWNRFVPGSYTDLTARQGTIASALGASHRVDFSSNVADGASTEGLQAATDQKGFRAAFFWNANGNHEFLLVSENHISCPGDKVGDGEAIAFDGNGDTFAFNGAQTASAAGEDWITVRGSPLAVQNGRATPKATYYQGHWMHIVEGPGLSQTRRIVDYVENSAAGTVRFRVAPRWDVVPAPGKTRMIVTRQYWQVYTIANEIDQRTPLCRKSNLTGPNAGVIGMWTPSADSVIAGNRQFDTSGILFLQGHSVMAPSCPTCTNSGSFQAAFEIRGNFIEGEYDYDSDCSDSGIFGAFGASPTPESLPPVGSLGVVIAHNIITRADAFRGGAIDITATWHRGPPPGDWPIVVNPLIFHNTIRDITGGPPRATCRRDLRKRVGIRLDGSGNVRDAVLYANRCERVDNALDDKATGTARVCSGPDESSCECARRLAPP